MRPVILAWQMGAGRGHISALKRVAIALGPLFEIDAALGSLEYAGELAGLCKYIYPCAGLSLGAEAHKRSAAGASWGQYLGDCGFDDVSILTECFAWWHHTFKVRDPALVVCDYAPVAQWTARAMGIPVVTVGTAFGQPLSSLDTFPQILSDHSGWHHDEGSLVENVNTATKALAFRPLERLPQLYEVDKQILMSFPELDPYSKEARGQYVSPVPTLNTSGHAPSSGDEILVYFSTSETKNLPLIDALSSLGLPVRAYIPNISNEQAARLQKAGVFLLAAAANPSEIKQRSRMILNAGQHGTLSLGIALGLPQFAVPQQLEQLYHARCAAALGGLAMPRRTGISAEEFRECMRAAYFDNRLAEQALRVQSEVQSSLPVNATVQLRKALELFLPKAFSF